MNQTIKNIICSLFGHVYDYSNPTRQFTPYHKEYKCTRCGKLKIKDNL